jgi:hypothetical protein
MVHPNDTTMLEAVLDRGAAGRLVAAADPR